MVVTKIEPVAKSRFKVEVDEQFAFTLYKGELSKYKIKEKIEISEHDYLEIRNKIVLKRAKLRAMHLLEDMDRTESQLRTKLIQGYYPGDIAEEAIAYVKSFGYINDEEYAKRFVNSRKEKKSKKEIYAALMQKGLPKEIIETALEIGYLDVDSKQAILELMKKKKYDVKTASVEEKRKILAFLMRKGFNYEDIRQVIQVSEWNA